MSFYKALFQGDNTGKLMKLTQSLLDRNADNESNLECKISRDYDVTAITSYLTSVTSCGGV